MVEAPMVAMTMLKIGAVMIGRTTTRSRITPMNPERTIVMSSTSQVGKSGPDEQGVADEAADHDELALREVHHVGGLEDEDEAESDERVHAASRQPADHLTGQDLDHLRRLRSGAAEAARARRRPSDFA